VAKFVHKRYPALTLQDEKGVWAQFKPEERAFGEHQVKVGVLTTNSTALIKRLTACPDPDLTRADEPESEATPDPEPGTGSE
jgi:hypothetical protein